MTSNSLVNLFGTISSLDLHAQGESRNCGENCHLEL